MNIWLHRISHCSDISYKLLDKGYISIGFSEVSNEEFMEKVIDGDWEYFDREYNKIWGKQRTRYALWRFLNEFKSDDWVLVPKGSKFSVYKILGKPQLFKDVNNLNSVLGKETLIKDKVYLNNNQIDIGFVWKGEIIAENILRKDVFDRAIISRMKVRDTNANITDLKSNVEKVVEMHKSYKKYNIHDEILNHTEVSIENIIGENLDADKFERLIKWYLEQIGASYVDIPSKNEHGKENGADADIVATFENLRVVIYVQAKYHKGYTSVWSVDQIIEYKKQMEDIDDEYTYIPWVITSADKFSNDAITKAKELGVRLINISELVKMIMDCGFNNINGAFL